eukprot:scaffold90493_cov63-Phaeocystis_antarctica.AAC.1
MPLVRYGALPSPPPPFIRYSSENLILQVALAARDRNVGRAVHARRAGWPVAGSAGGLPVQDRRAGSRAGRWCTSGWQCKIGSRRLSYLAAAGRRVGQNYPQLRGGRGPCEMQP